MIKQNAYKALFIHHYLYIIAKRNWAHCNQSIKRLNVSYVELFNYSESTYTSAHQYHNTDRGI